MRPTDPAGNDFTTAWEEIDLTYEGIATGSACCNPVHCLSEEIDLTYEGIATLSGD